VAYKASANVVTDLIGGYIQCAFFNYMTGMAQVAAGQLKPIAITESKRNPRWPGVPTISESVPGYEVSFFIGISAPRGVPAEVIAKVQQAIHEAQDEPKVRGPLEGTGLAFVRQMPGEYRTFIINESDRWREHVKAARIVPQ
jgi:tripartite-type tricarboxylate transporter receptor subunit TctC